MISDSQIDQLFEEFLESPELTSWRSDLSGREHSEATRLFRVAVLKAIAIDLAQHVTSTGNVRVTNSHAAE
jgi:hypothetical protein